MITPLYADAVELEKRKARSKTHIAEKIRTRRAMINSLIGKLRKDPSNGHVKKDLLLQVQALDRDYGVTVELHEILSSLNQ